MGPRRLRSASTARAWERRAGRSTFDWLVSIIDFGHVEWQFFSRMSGRPICSQLVGGDAAVEGHDPAFWLGHIERKVEGLTGHGRGIDLEVLHPVLNGVAGDVQVSRP